jgi:twitching motility protein PilT
MGNGKTATAASLIVDRLKQGGGLAIALEDPLETNLDGVHGERSGRCVQVQASRKTGGFKEHLIKTMRTGADLIFVGEIRDGDTAEQAAIGALNGHLMIATMHASSPSSAIERFITLAKSGGSRITNIEDIVAAGLSIVVTQSLTRGPVGLNGKSFTRLTAQHLILTGQDGLGIREKIRSGKAQTLTQDVDHQSRQSTFGIKN